MTGIIIIIIYIYINDIFHLIINTDVVQYGVELKLPKTIMSQQIRQHQK